MATYKDAELLLRQLRPIINQCIENHPLIKSSIKAQKAVVWAAPDAQKRTVAVKFLPDIFNEEIAPFVLPYNPIMESFLTSGDPVGRTVSVWYYQSLSNGIVMQDGAWDEAPVSSGSASLENYYTKEETKQEIQTEIDNAITKVLNTPV